MLFRNLGRLGWVSIKMVLCDNGILGLFFFFFFSSYSLELPTEISGLP